MWTGYENFVWRGSIRHFGGYLEKVTETRVEILDAYVSSFAVTVPMNTEAVSLDGRLVQIIEGMAWKHPVLFPRFNLVTRIRRFPAAASGRDPLDPDKDLLVFENVPLIYFGNRVPVVRPIARDAVR